MEKEYELLWKETIIGNVYTNEEGKFKYIPNIENIRGAASEGMPATLVIIPQIDWKETPPPFINSRLNLIPNGVITDSFKIVAIN